MNAAGIYRSEAGREKVLSYYEQVLRALPFRRRYVETSFGRTFLLEAGEAGRPAVLLLHGSCSNSAFWFGEMMALSARYYVYAADLIGEAGNSAETRPDLRSPGYALWLAEVLDALGVGETAVIGNSLGGWAALQFAAAFPMRVARLVLIGASGLTPPKPPFLEQARAFASGETEGTGELSSVTGEAQIPQEALAFLGLILEHFIPIADPLPLFSDAELQNLSMPVLFLAGEEDVTMEARSAGERLAALAPKAEIRLLPGCGHLIMQPAEIILPFLEGGVLP